MSDEQSPCEIELSGGTPKFDAAIEKLSNEEPRRAKWIYLMVFAAIERLFHRIHRSGVRTPGDVEPADLFASYAGSAVDLFGYMAPTVLEECGIDTADDLWEVCLRLNGAGLLTFRGSTEAEKAKFDGIDAQGLYGRRMSRLARSSFEVSLRMYPPRMVA